ncbi:nucleolar protein [Elasticomyces elasticus]|nr:nucleolar protein [Elasticomyces elasticus]
MAVDTGKKRKGALEPTVTAKKLKKTDTKADPIVLKSALKKPKKGVSVTNSAKPSHKRAADADNEPTSGGAEPANIEVPVKKSKKLKTAPKPVDDAPSAPIEVPAKKFKKSEPVTPVAGADITADVTPTIDVPGKKTKKIRAGKPAPEEIAPEHIAAPVAVSAKKSKKSKAAAAPIEKGTVAGDTAASDNDGEEDVAVDDQTAALLAGFESSDDEKELADEGAALDKIPDLPDNKNLLNELKEAGKSDANTPGVIFVGRIPHGFFEHQMRAYFSQFGEISTLRLSRNRRTGHSKHYAFIRFASSAVADIVAKTMDKYLMFGHILQVKRIPDEQVHENLFKGAGRRFKPAPWAKLEGRRLREGMERKGWEKRVQGENKRRSIKADKMKVLGYDYEMPALKAVDEVPVKQAVDGAAMVGGKDASKTISGDAHADAEPKGETLSIVLKEPGDVAVVETAKQRKPKSDGLKVKKTKKAKA